MIRNGFTLIELMVVILIILLVSAVVLPTVLPAIQHRQVTEAARILQAGLVQARAIAVKNQAPRGIRFLPDPTYASSPSILAYNRWVPIEPGPDYSSGLVTIWPLPTVNDVLGGQVPIPFSTPLNGPSGPYPYHTQAVRFALNYPNPVVGGQVLMVEQAPFTGNDPNQPLNNPTSWFWNVRIGDTIQINGQGREYTVIGPMVQANPELFVNDGPPGQFPLLTRSYINTAANVTQQFNPEYLFLLNGLDDDQDGFIDNGWDGFDNNYNGTVDDAYEFSTSLPVGQTNPTVQSPGAGEVEQWAGAERGVTGTFSKYAAVFNVGTTTTLPQPATYTISRRPVVSPGARETALPTNVVIDATTWNLTAERSRLPIDPKSFYVDVIFNPNGQVTVQTEYSSPTSVSTNSAFYHFWLAERADVFEILDHTANGVPYLLPMPRGSMQFANNLPSGFPAANDISARELKGERMLLTLFTRTGQVTTNTVEFFKVGDPSNPFYDSQLGAREAK